MPRRTPAAFLLAATALTAFSAAPAAAERSIDPYIEVAQILDVDFDDGGDVLTYTSIAAGVDASIRNARSEGQISYRYERRIPYDDDLETEDVHTGLARGSVQLVPNLLRLDGGALAARSRVSFSGAAPELLSADTDNITEVYSVYAGPSLATRVGAFNVSASYNLGYTKVEEQDDFLLAPGVPAVDRFDSSTFHNANASIGMGTGALPFAWTLFGGWQREDASQLDQRFDATYARLDLTVPITPTLALVGGVGYEDIEQSQRDFARDAQGNAILDQDGRFVEGNGPRLLAYDEDGLIYDAGVLWRPNRRTSLEARVGHRYGGTTYTGQLSYQTGRNSGLYVNVYDGISSFGRLTSTTLAGLPTQFETPRNPFGNGFGGCVFGAEGASGGGCFDNPFQSVNNANFRNRGVSATFAGQRGAWTYGLGGGYARRRYFAPKVGAAGFTIDGVVDESWTVQANLGRALTPVSQLDLGLYGNWFDSGIAQAGDVKSAGATGTYSHQFGRISALASLGFYASDEEFFETDYNGSLLLGARYNF